MVYAQMHVTACNIFCAVFFFSDLVWTVTAITKGSSPSPTSRPSPSSPSSSSPSPPSCSVSMGIVDGQYARRSTCVAGNAWVALDFATSPSFVLFAGQLYVKDPALRRYVPHVKTLPPSIPFDGLVHSFSGPIPYDETTCDSRCCRQVEVHSSGVECDNDWTRCATLQPSSALPQCNGTLQTGCSAWVPCDANPRVDILIPGLILSACTAGVLSVLWLREQQMLFRVVLTLVLSVKVAVLFIALVPHSDYAYWMENTETAPDFAAYQACAEFCSLSDSYLIILTRFCADRRLDLSEYAIFEANQNRFLAADESCMPASDDVAYCQSCYARRGDWLGYEQLQLYLWVHALLEWALVLCVLAVYAWSFRWMRLGLRVAAIMLGLMYVAFFLADIVKYVDATKDRLYGAFAGYAMFGQAIRIDARSVCLTLIFFDLVSALLALYWAYDGFQPIEEGGLSGESGGALEEILVSGSTKQKVNASDMLQTLFSRHNNHNFMLKALVKQKRYSEHGV